MNNYKITRLLNKQWLCILIIVLATIAAFSNSLGNDFIVDDHIFIVNYPLIRDWNNFPEFFGPRNQPVGEEGVYSPLKTCFHALNYHLWGLNQFGHHFVGLLIHLIGTIFAFKIALRLTKNPTLSFLAGIFFGLHPVHVEAITPPTGSVDTSGVVWFFVSFYFYTKVGEVKSKWNKNYFFAFLFAVFATFTHELVITLPLFLVLYEICFGPKGMIKKSILKTIPFFILSFTYALIKFAVAGSIGRGRYLYDSFYLTMLVIIKALVKYVTLLFFPIALNSNHELSPGIFSVNWYFFDKASVLTQSIFDLQVIFSLLFTFSIIWVGVISYKKNRIISFCVGWFYISLLPVMNFIPTECYFAERYLYPGSLVFSIILAMIILYPFSGKGFVSRKIFKVGSICLLIFYVSFFFAKTLQRNHDIRSELSAFQAEVKNNPRYPIHHRTVAILYLHNGQPLKAIEHLEIAVKLFPQDPDAYFSLGESYLAVNNFTRARNSFLKAVEYDPEFADSYYNLAGIQAFLGDRDLARKHLNKSFELFKKTGRLKEGIEAKEAFFDYWGYQ